VTPLGKNAQFLGGHLYEPDLHLTDKYNLAHGIEKHDEVHAHIHQPSRANPLEPMDDEVNHSIISHNGHYPLYAEFLRKAVNDTERVRLACSRKIPLKSQRSTTQPSLASAPQTPIPE